MKDINKIISLKLIEIYSYNAKNNLYKVKSKDVDRLINRYKREYKVNSKEFINDLNEYRGLEKQLKIK